MTARRFVAVIDDEPDLAVLFSDALNSYGIKALALLTQLLQLTI